MPQDVAVVDSTNMDLVVQVPEVPVPRETALAGTLQRSAGRSDLT